METALSRELGELKQEILRRELLISGCAEEAKGHAISQGKAMMNAREIIAETDDDITWGEWVESELQMSMYQVDRRVRIAQVDQLELKGLTLEQAEKKIGQPRTRTKKVPYWLQERNNGIFTQGNWPTYLENLEVILDIRDSIDHDARKAERAIETIAIHQHNGSEPPAEVINTAQEYLEKCRKNYLEDDIDDTGN